MWGREVKIKIFQDVFEGMSASLKQVDIIMGQHI